MSIQKLLKIISMDNVADMLNNSETGKQQLVTIGKDVVIGYDTDWTSMQDWREDVDKGLELVKPATKGRSEPWEGASNHKTPLLMEARIRFGDRATEELLGTGKVVKCKTVGKDPLGKKDDRIERVEGVMNWQLTVEADSWMDEQDALLYNLACQGSIFKKAYFDSSEGHNVSEVIMFPNFAINQSTKALDKAARFTHRIFKTPNEILEMQNAGVWLEADIELGAKATDDDAEETEKDLRTEFYEQQCYLDLDGDGYDEPYAVTVHAASCTVVRIVAQIALDDIFIRNANGVTITVDRVIAKDENGNPLIIDDVVQFETKTKDWQIIKITREKCLIEYKFLTNPQAEYLSVGYFHILGTYCQTINATTNQLVDSGTLANLQGGWLAKGFRKRMGDIDAAPAQWLETGLSAHDLKNGVLPHQFKEPSQTLFALRGELMSESMRLASTTDLASTIGPNTPAETTLSMVHEKQEAVGAIILRIWRSMSREFGIWYKLNSKYMDFQLYKTLVDNDEADPMMDFNTQDMDIAPASSPKNNSKIQRIHKATAQLGVIDQIRGAGGQVRPVIEEYLEAIGSDSIDQIFPKLTPEQEQQAKQESDRVKQLEEQLRFLPVKAQADIGEAEKGKVQVAMAAEQTKREKNQTDGQLTQAKTQNTMIDSQKKAAETNKIKVETDAQSLETDVLSSKMLEMTDGPT